MKDRNLHISILAILCLTGCTQPIKELSTSRPMPVPPASKDLSSLNPKANNLKANSPAIIDTTSKNAQKNTDNSQLLSDLTQKLLAYKLDKPPSDAIICSVNNVPITFGDYRREFKIEQQEIQASLTYNAELANRLLQAAQKQGITLSPKERESLLKSTSKMQIGGKKSFDKMLSEGHMNKKQFDDQVLGMGLACKTANIMVESNLLNELVNHQLLSQAAKDNGFSKEAMNKYTETVRSGEYKKLLATGAFSADDLHSEIINNELCAKEAEKIKSGSPLTDVELNDFYEKNRGKFRHGARIRLSHIFIALPGATEKNTQSQTQKYQLAQSLLERARNGEDFAELANQYSEDSAKRKNDGGDLGLQEEAKLSQDFAAKIVKLAPGTVVPEVIVSPHGYHIFKVTKKESPGYYRLAEVQGELKGILGQQKDKQTVNNWLADQRQKATIVISPELQNLLATNKLENREDARTTIRHSSPRMQISGQGRHF